MSAAERLSSDLLRDSEATLRLADALLGDLRGSQDAAHAGLAQHMERKPSATLALPTSLIRAYSEIITALESLRRYRGMLEATTVDRVHRTQAKLREVSSATEVAATSLLDGLDRALGMVDRLDGMAAADESDAKELRADLRDELFGLMGHLQFQDITAQQLQHASAVLGELEHRLVGIASLFDATFSGDPSAIGQVEHGETFDPAASLFDADARQAIADDIFG